MLEALLKFLPIAGSVISQAPEFLNLIKSIKTTLSEDDQEVLQNALVLAQTDSDEAYAELEALVAARR